MTNKRGKLVQKVSNRRCPRKKINQDLCFSKSQVFSYIGKQKKPISIKVSKETLWVCQLEITRPVGGKILTRQTIRVSGGGFLSNLQLFWN